MPHSFNNIRVSLCSLTYAIQKGLFSSQSQTDDVLRRLYTQCCKFLAHHFKTMREGQALTLNSSIRNLVCFSSLGLSLVRHVNKSADGEMDPSRQLSSYIPDMTAFLASISLHWILALTHSSWASAECRQSLLYDMMHLLSIPEIVKSSKGLEAVVQRYVQLRDNSNGKFPSKPLPNMIPLKSPLMFASRLLLESTIKDRHVTNSVYPLMVDSLIKAMPETICDVDEDGSTPVAMMASLVSGEDFDSSWGLSSVNMMESMTAAASQSHGIADSNGDIPLHVAAACGNSAVMIWIIDHTPELASRQNGAGCCPLHLALSSLRDHPDESLLRLLACFPDASRIADRHGCLPLHYAMRTASIHVIEAIYAANPAAITQVTEAGSSCLHLSMQRSCNCVQNFSLSDSEDGAVVMLCSGMCEDARAVCPIVEFVLSRAPALAALQNGQGQSALHVAVSNPLISPATVRRLLVVHPGAARVVDGENCLPLHYAASRVSYAVGGIEDGTTASSRARSCTGAVSAADAEEAGGRDSIGGGLRNLFRSLRLQKDIIRDLLRCYPAGANAGNADGITPLEMLRDHLRLSDTDPLPTVSAAAPPSAMAAAAPSYSSTAETAVHIANVLEELLSSTRGLMTTTTSAGAFVTDVDIEGAVTLLLPAVEAECSRGYPHCRRDICCPCKRSRCPWTECTAAMVGLERLLLRADASQDEERLRELNWRERRAALMAWQRIQQRHDIAGPDSGADPGPYQGDADPGADPLERCAVPGTDSSHPVPGSEPIQGGVDPSFDQSKGCPDPGQSQWSTYLCSDQSKLGLGHDPFECGAYPVPDPFKGVADPGPGFCSDPSRAGAEAKEAALSRMHRTGLRGRQRRLCTHKLDPWDEDKLCSVEDLSGAPTKAHEDCAQDKKRKRSCGGDGGGSPCRRVRKRRSEARRGESCVDALTRPALPNMSAFSAIADVSLIRTVISFL